MSHGLIGVAEANRRLETMLVGDRFVGFETGDVWTLSMQEKGYLVAFQRMSSAKEEAINQALRRTDNVLFDCCDPEEISWAVILASVTRKKIIAATVDGKAALSLIFEGGVEIIIRTDADIVDWQWCITRNAPNPYTEEAELACLWKSEISRWDHS